MYQTVSNHDFNRAFETSTERRHTFSYEAQNALFEYLEQLEDDTGERIELDIVALCCEYTEYETFAAFVHDYSDEYGDDWESLMDHTTVIPIPGTDGAIVAQF